MKVLRILRCILYIDNDADTAAFITTNSTLDLNALCCNHSIQEKFTFIHAFTQLFGCPPSNEIVKMRSSDFVNFVSTKWPFIPCANIKKAYAQAKQCLTTRSQVRAAITGNLLHFSASSLSTSPDATLVDVFYNVFGDVETWIRYNKVLDENLNDTYAISRCLKSTCLINTTQSSDLYDLIFREIDKSMSRKLHVFGIDHTSDRITHTSNPNCFPLSLFERRLVICKDCVEIDGVRLDIPVPTLSSSVLNDCNELTAALVIHVLQSSDKNKICNFWNRITTYWNRIKVVGPFNPLAKNVIIACDSRKNPLTVASFLLSSSMLDCSTWRQGVMFCNKLHVEYYTKMLAGVAIVCGIDDLTTSKFGYDEYNDLLLSSKLWHSLDALGVVKVLLVQDDGFLIRRGVERFLVYDYVGAPWNPNQPELKMLTNPEMVGNGGLSIRSVRAMLDVSTRYETMKTEMWPSTLTQLPEDVYFSRGLFAAGYAVCPREKALHFASEQVLTLHCCGVHKPWPYMSATDIGNLLQYEEEGEGNANS